MTFSTTDTTLVDVTMPQMGVSVAEGTIVAWAKQPGDAVAADETIVEISTDKIDTEVPAPASGVLTDILVPVGETVEVGTVLARIATEGQPLTADHEGEDADRAGGARSDDSARRQAAGAPTSTTGPARSPAQTRPNGTRYSPVVTRIAAEHGIDLARLTGTGRAGRVTKKDVLAHIEAPTERPLHSESPYRPDPEPATGAPQRLSRMRQSIGAAMRHSLDTAATCTTIVECDMTRVEVLRKERGLTALPLVARATVETLAEFPDLNATLDGTTLTRYEHVHLGIAVSLGDDGLIVPVIRDAQQLAPEGIAARVKDLATRARAKQLTPDEVRGATFTITSPGQYGALAATPVIDVPQVAILDLEAIVRRPVVVTAADGSEAIAIRSMAYLCMSWDHRALDGAYAARFLTALRRRLEGEG